MPQFDTISTMCGSVQHVAARSHGAVYGPGRVEGECGHGRHGWSKRYAWAWHSGLPIEHPFCYPRSAWFEMGEHAGAGSSDAGWLVP